MVLPESKNRVENLSAAIQAARRDYFDSLHRRLDKMGVHSQVIKVLSALDPGAFALPCMVDPDDLFEYYDGDPVKLRGFRTAATSPYLIAKFLSEVYKAPDFWHQRSFLELGSGCGTLVAAARLLGYKRVVGLEAEEEIAAISRITIERMGLKACKIYAGDGFSWLQEHHDEFDSIVVSAKIGKKESFDKIGAHLKEGGKLVAPWYTHLVLVEKTRGQLTSPKVVEMGVSFVELKNEPK